MSTLTPMVQAVKNLKEKIGEGSQDFEAENLIFEQEIKRQSEKIDFYESMDRKIALWHVGSTALGYDNEIARKYRKLLEELTTEELFVLKKSEADHDNKWTSNCAPDRGGLCDYFLNYDGYRFSGDALKLYDRAWDFHNQMQSYTEDEVRKERRGSTTLTRSVFWWVDSLEQKHGFSIDTSLEASGITFS